MDTFRDLPSWITFTLEHMSAISILRQPQFRRIFAAQAISTFGDNIAPIAVAFAVLQVTHSGTDLGLVLAARTIPMAVFVVLGGAWADRLPRKRVMVVSDITRFLSQGAFAIVLIGHSPSLWSLLLLQAINGTATAFFLPASSGLVQEAVPAPDRQSANALLSAANNISAIGGPALAAILIALAGNAWALGVDALTFAVSAAFLYGVVVAPRVTAGRTSIAKEIAEGFRAVTSRRWLAIEIGAFAEFQFFVLASYSVLGPLISERDYSGATTWALVASLSGVGALVGDGISIRLKPGRPLVAANVASLGCLPILVALAISAPLPILVACGFVFGFGISVSNTFWFTAMQQNVPQRLMARVSAFDWMGSMALRPIGLAVVAPVAVAIGPGVVLVVAAAVSATTLVMATLHPSVRDLRGSDGQDIIEPDAPGATL